MTLRSQNLRYSRRFLNDLVEFCIGPTFGGPTFGGPTFGGPTFGGPTFGGPTFDS